MSDFVEQHKVINISIAIILFITAFIAPAAIIYPIKKGYVTREALEFGTTPWALLTGGMGILALSAIFIIFAVSEKAMLKIVSTIILSLVMVLGIFLSIKDYYYITQNHFVSNGPFSFVEKIYEWDDFESVEESLGKVDGAIFVETIIFRMKDGEQFEYDGKSLRTMFRYIISRVEDAGGEHIRTDAK